MLKLSINFFKETKEEAVKIVSPESEISITADIPNQGSKIFSAADLWYIQQQGRTTITRRWIY